MGELKPGWKRVKFGEVVRQVKEKADPETSGLERFIAGEHMDTDDLRIRRWGDIEDGYLGPAFHARFRPGQVLYGSRRTYLRKVAVANFDGICANTTFVLESRDPDVLLPELLPFIMQMEAFHEHSKRESKGSVNPYVNFSDLAWYEFALPPLEEQRRIAGALQAARGLCDATDLLAQSAQALSTPLFCELVGLPPNAPVGPYLNGIHSHTKTGIPLLRVEDVGSPTRQSVQVGPFGGSVSSKYFRDRGTPVLKINNITNSGLLDLSDCVYLSEEQAEALSGRYSVQSGDLVTAAQAVIGRTAVVPPEAAGAIISQHLIRIAVDRNRVSADWLHACFYTPFVLRQLHGVVQGGTRAGLNSGDVRSILLPVPDAATQAQILARLARARQAYTDANHRLERAHALMLVLRSEGLT